MAKLAQTPTADRFSKQPQPSVVLGDEENPSGALQFLIALCELCLGYVFWITLEYYFFVMNGYQVNPDGFPYGLYWMTFILFAPSFMFIAPLRRFFAKIHPLLRLPALASMMLYLYSDPLVRLIIVSIAVWFLVAALISANELPAKEREHFWWGTIVGVLLLTASKLFYYSLDPIYISFIPQIVIVGVGFLAAVFLFIVKMCALRQPSTIKPTEDDEAGVIKVKSAVTAAWASPVPSAPEPEPVTPVAMSLVSLPEDAPPSPLIVESPKSPSLPRRVSNAPAAPSAAALQRSPTGQPRAPAVKPASAMLARSASNAVNRNSHNSTDGFAPNSCDTNNNSSNDDVTIPTSGPRRTSIPTARRPTLPGAAAPAVARVGSTIRRPSQAAKPTLTSTGPRSVAARSSAGQDGGDSPRRDSVQSTASSTPDSPSAAERKQSIAAAPPRTTSSSFSPPRTSSHVPAPPQRTGSVKQQDGGGKFDRFASRRASEPMAADEQDPILSGAPSAHAEDVPSTEVRVIARQPSTAVRAGAALSDSPAKSDVPSTTTAAVAADGTAPLSLAAPAVPVPVSVKIHPPSRPDPLVLNVPRPPQKSKDMAGSDGASAPAGARALRDKALPRADYILWLPNGVAFGCLLFLTHFFFTSTGTIWRLVSSMSLPHYPYQLTAFAFLAGVIVSFFMRLRFWWFACITTGCGLLIHTTGVAQLVGVHLIVFALPLAWADLKDEIWYMGSKSIAAFQVAVFVYVFWIMADYCSVWVRNWYYIAACGAFLRQPIYIMWPAVCALAFLPLIASIRGALTTVNEDGSRRSFMKELFVPKPRVAHGEFIVVAIAFVICVIAASVVYRSVYYVTPPAAPLPSGTGQLWVMSYNVAQGTRTDGRVNFQSVEDVIRANPAHVIGMQQSDTQHIFNSNRDVVEYLGGQLGLNNYYGAVSWHRTSGNAVLSSYGLTSVNAPFPTTDSTFIASRPFTTAVVSLNSTFQVTVVVADLNQIQQSDAVAQAQQLANYVNSLSGAVVVTVDAGDVWTGPVLGALRNVGLLSAYHTLHVTDVATSELTNTMVDFVLYRGLVPTSATVVTSASGSSFHVPVLASFVVL
eukprot:TRINITY_DN572_c0_g1_i1.p1 TRINITY_DN572_c0_g1~~TRINITY_DN572_c0_g1_i1.p1  ORF type:complete len:1268 (+),score=269.40 TRINITY_DN572_c0_g1_i1:533-3805(+)